MTSWELIIVGAGPAGLAAGIYSGRSRVQTLVLEAEMAGGTTADAPRIENYPGIQNITGQELAKKMTKHCRSVDIEIHELERAVDLELKGSRKTVKTSKATYTADAVILACGTRYKKLGISGEREFYGKGVSYCGICDGPLFKDKRVLVVGGGDSAVMTALYVADLASEVKMLHRKKAFRAQECLVDELKKRKNVEILWNTELKKIKGLKTVNSVELFNNKIGKHEEMEVDGVFIQVGEVPNSKSAKTAGVELDEEGYIVVDMRQRTNLEGVFAAGDITNHTVKQVGTAVGQGITAALEAYGYIRRPYYYRR